MPISPAGDSWKKDAMLSHPKYSNKETTSNPKAIVKYIRPSHMPFKTRLNIKNPMPYLPISTAFFFTLEDMCFQQLNQNDKKWPTVMGQRARVRFES